MAYSQHGNGTRAAIEAGYSPGGNSNGAASRAVELLRRPLVKARIAELHSVVARLSLKAVSVDRAWVLKMLIENAESAVKAEDRPSANRALELVGKELGMFIDRKMDVKSPLDALTAQELTALVELIDRGGLLDITPRVHRVNEYDPVDIIGQSDAIDGVHATIVPIDEAKGANGAG